MVVHTWNVGDVITAAHMNDYVRDSKQVEMAIARAAGTQAVASGTTTGVLLAGTEDSDVDGMHSTSVSTNLFTPVNPGWYRLAGFVECTTSSPGGSYRQLTVLKNAIADISNSGWGFGFSRVINPNNVGPQIGIVSVPIWCNGTTDNLQVALGHDRGSDITISDACICVYRYRG